MKTRINFVSNSSSTSFLIVGTENKTITKLLAAAEKIENEGFASYNEGKVFVYLGGNNEYEEPGEPYTPYYVGLEAEKKLNEGRTVAQLRVEFIEKAKKLIDISVPPNEVNLYFGEVLSD